MGRRTSRFSIRAGLNLSQENQLWHDVRAGPDDRVLAELRTQCLRIVQGKTKREETLLARPAIAGVLADTADEAVSALLEDVRQCPLPLKVAGRILLLAKGIARRDEGAAGHAVRFVQRSQHGVGLAHLQRGRGAAVHVVVGFQISLDDVLRNCRVRKQKTLR